MEAAQAAGFAHSRLVVLIEASEESGSPTCRRTWRRCCSASAHRSQAFYGTSAYTFGEGGTISFMAMLGQKLRHAGGTGAGWGT